MGPRYSFYRGVVNIVTQLLEFILLLKKEIGVGV